MEGEGRTFIVEHGLCFGIVSVHLSLLTLLYGWLRGIYSRANGRYARKIAVESYFFNSLLIVFGGAEGDLTRFASRGAPSPCVLPWWIREILSLMHPLVRSPYCQNKKGWPWVNPLIVLVELRGIEPLTPRLPASCSPSWATAPLLIAERTFYNITCRCLSREKKAGAGKGRYNLTPWGHGEFKPE